MSSAVWSPTRSRALALCALGLAISLALTAAPALANGPGVRLISNSDSDAVVELSGAQIAQAADVHSRTYTLRKSAGSAGEKLKLTGLSIGGLLRLAGFDPTQVKFIQIVRDDGSLATLKRADFADPSPFFEGPALVTDEGTTTRFFRPVRDASSTNVRDNIVVSGTPLDVTVDGGALLAVRARANPRKTTVGHTVRFRARVRFPPPGATFTYQWDFGDGTSAVGASVTHKYAGEGPYTAQVNVDGTGGTGAVCQATCGGVASVNVRIGHGQKLPRPGLTPGGGSGGGTTATGSTGGGSGTGASGNGSGSGSSADAGTSGQPGRTPARRATRPPPATGGPTITGILLADSTSVLRSTLPRLSRAGGQTAPTRAAASGSAGGGRIGGSLAVTLVLVACGALYERRRSTLRIA
jgi:PKD repeat protein